MAKSLAPRVGLKPLAMFCRRLGTSLDAGIDVRKTIETELGANGNRTYRQNMAHVRSAVASGDSLTDAFQQTNGYFPPFFCEMVKVGEKTGTLDRVLLKLADHYEHLLSLRSIFIAGIAWPMIQLVAVIFILGIMILALGWVASFTGESVDILGFGLVGVPGLIRYIIGLVVIGAVGYGIYLLCTRGPIANTCRGLLMKLPGIGKSLQVISLSRMAWSLGLAIDAGADARTSMRMALQSTLNDYYTQHADQIDEELQAGQEMHEVLRHTQAFPPDFIDSVEVGEQSGRLTEMMEKLAANYQTQAKTAATVLTVMATMVVWGGVAAPLIVLIFRVFGFYLGILQEATQM